MSFSRLRGCMCGCCLCAFAVLFRSSIPPTPNSLGYDIVDVDVDVGGYKLWEYSEHRYPKENKFQHPYFSYRKKIGVS